MLCLAAWHLCMPTLARQHMSGVALWDTAEHLTQGGLPSCCKRSTHKDQSKVARHVRRTTSNMSARPVADGTCTVIGS